MRDSLAGRLPAFPWDAYIEGTGAPAAAGVGAPVESDLVPLAKRRRMAGYVPFAREGEWFTELAAVGGPTAPETAAPAAWVSRPTPEMVLQADTARAAATTDRAMILRIVGIPEW